MIVIGLVGTIAAGKSTAAEHLASLGAAWINADEIAKACLEEPDVIQALTERFGDRVRESREQINRAQLAKLVFGDTSTQKENLRYLESLVHPRTRSRIHDAIVQAASTRSPAALLDVPLLFESGWDLACDAIFCLDADRSIRRQRAANRGWAAGELERREAAQMAIEKKIQLSQVVMRNEATLLSLRQNLSRQWAKLCRIDQTDTAGSISPDGHCLSDWT
ncbi:MAG: dephospho-CoA kinase [Planctomycetota bacterium]